MPNPIYNKIVLAILAVFLIALVLVTKYRFSNDADFLTIESLIKDIKTMVKNPLSDQYTVSSPPESAANDQPSPSPASPPSFKTSLIQWGAYAGDKISDLEYFESQVGKPVNISAIFVGWGEGGSFPFEYAAKLREQKKTLLIFWEPNFDAPYNQIIQGSFDGYVKQFAQDAKNYQGQIILVPFAEMNGNWNNWSGTIGQNSPAKFIAAWQKIRNLFLAIPNVKFGWAPNHVSLPDTPQNQLEKYYPGDEFVDYVGVDGFNFGDPWLSFSEIFDSALTQLAVYDKPIYIFSFACSEGPKKAQWITDAFLEISTYQNIIQGWVWFNENKEKDWRVWSDKESLAAFKAALP